MPFDLSTAKQSSEFEHAIKASLYKSIHESAISSKANKHLIKFSGFGIGVVSALLTIANRIARIAESILKGVINIFGAPCSDNCHAKTGLKQLFIDAPWQLVVKLPLSIIGLLFSVPYKTFSFGAAPKTYSKKLWLDHDLIEKQIQIEAPKIATFKKAEAEVQTTPDDISALKTLGDCYHRGFGTPANRDRAIECYERAANLQDANSMKILGDIYELTDRATSLSWYKKGSEAGDLDAAFKMGLHYHSKGRQSSIKKAIECFKQAAESGHVLSKACLLELLHVDEITQLGWSCSDPERQEAKSYLGIK